jgi:hypothetical protein
VQLPASQILPMGDKDGTTTGGAAPSGESACVSNMHNCAHPPLTLCRGGGTAVASTSQDYLISPCRADLTIVAADTVIGCKGNCPQNAPK